MATVTPNYNWPVPQSTDFVKDGADSIKDLGDAIDATVFGLPSGAFAHIITTTFSAQTIVSFNDVFTSTYENYVIKLNLTANTTADLYLRVRASGTDLSSAVYYYTNIHRSNTAFSNGAQNRGESIIGIIKPTKTAIDVSFFSPQLTTRTSLTSNGSYFETSGAYGNWLSSATVDDALSYDGFSIIPVSGNITGTIRVYGVQN
jgi:hypothetical protein